MNSVFVLQCLKNWSCRCLEECVACAEMYCKIVMFERAMESLVVQGAQKNRPNYVQVK